MRRGMPPMCVAGTDTTLASPVLNKSRQPLTPTTRGLREEEAERERRRVSLCTTPTSFSPYPTGFSRAARARAANASEAVAENVDPHVRMVAQPVAPPASRVTRPLTPNTAVSADGTQDLPTLPRLPGVVARRAPPSSNVTRPLTPIAPALPVRDRDRDAVRLARTHLGKVGGRWSSETFLALALLQGRYNVSANRAGEVMACVDAISHWNLDRLTRVLRASDPGGKRPENLPGRTVAQYALITCGIMLDVYAALLMSASEWLWIGTDGTTKCAAGRKFVEFSIGGVALLQGGERMAWTHVVEFEEVLSEGAKDILELVLDGFERLKSYQREHNLRVSELFDVRVLVYDNTSTNTGKLSGFGVRFEQARTEQWRIVCAALERPIPLHPLVLKGCADHIAALASTGFQAALTDFFRVAHPDLLANGRVYKNDIMMLCRRVYLLLGCGPRKPQFRGLGERAAKEQHVIINTKMERVTPVRFCSFDVMAMRVLHCRKLILNFIGILETTKEQSEHSYATQIKRSLSDERVLFVLSVMATAARRMLLPFMYTANQCTTVGEYRTRLRLLLEDVNSAKEMGLAWLLSDEVLESDYDMDKFVETRCASDDVVEELASASDPSAVASEGEEEDPDTEGDADLDLPCIPDCGRAFSDEEKLAQMVLYLDKIEEMVRKHDAPFLDGDLASGDHDDAPLRATNRQGERVFAQSDVFLDRQQRMSSVYIAACLKVANAKADHILQAYMLMMHSDVFPRYRKEARASDRGKTTRAQFNSQLLDILVAKSEQTAQAQARRRATEELEAPIRAWFTELHLLAPERNLTVPVLKEFLKEMGIPVGKCLKKDMIALVEDARQRSSPQYLHTCVQSILSKRAKKPNG
eukprot:TRINITY_DN11711_c0_g1_i1.p1 TRINITY_DN11711_c0_g1~~TRINITY_DN11711_c0_g1_i1.p1  ORF type:complete len:968 (+),score=124.07 TRINITY_DN11711_c0_g1_i1:296-2905(+)